MAENTFKGLHKLEDFSCEVINTNEVNSDERCCVLNFKVPVKNSESEEIKMLIDKPALNVLIDGLHKIQSQLNNVAIKNKG